jgi:hypothetical protein
MGDASATGYSLPPLVLSRRLLHREEGARRSGMLITIRDLKMSPPRVARIELDIERALLLYRTVADGTP